jgi:uncharacterized small protein (DUF1192 family)
MAKSKQYIIEELRAELAEARKKTEPGEFTKEYWKWIDSVVPNAGWKDRVIKCLKEIDRLTAENKQLKDDMEIGCNHTIDSAVDEDGCCISCGEDLNYIAGQQAEIDRLTAENNHQKEALSWLLGEYDYLSVKMTQINNIVQPLWSELRERRNDYQLVEEFIKQIQKEGIEQALKGGD